MGSQVSVMKQTLNEQHPGVPFKLEKEGYVKHNGDYYVYFEKTGRWVSGEQAIDALRQIKVPEVMGYDTHPDPDCSDVLIPKGLTRVFGNHGMVYQKIDGVWKLTQPIRYCEEPEVHKDLCRKENGKYIYRGGF